VLLVAEGDGLFGGEGASIDEADDDLEAGQRPRSSNSTTL
jgi:hypothetical protein